MPALTADGLPDLHDPALAEVMKIARAMGLTMTVTADANTAVSGGVAIPSGVLGNTGAPGGSGPAAQVSPTQAGITVLLVAAGGLIALRLIFGKGDKLPPVRIDAVNALAIYWSWLLVDVTLSSLPTIGTGTR